MQSEIPQAEYEAIEEMISSDDSPVGIDAKKTHVLILHKLASIEARLAKLEQAAGESPTRAPGNEAAG